jgi:hypothetical protein
MTRIVPIAAVDRTRERIAAIIGSPAEAEPTPTGPTITIAPAVRPAAPNGPSRFEALERFPGYWRGRASGRQAAIDFYRGIASQRETTHGVDVSQDALRDNQAIAEYERRAAL